MQAEIDAFNHEWRHGDRKRAKALATEYVAAHREEIMPALRAAVRTYREAHLDDDPSITDLVGLVDAFRASGDEASRTLIDMLLQADYQPQVITGAGSLTARFRPIVEEAAANG